MGTGPAAVTGGHPIYRWNGSGWTRVAGAAVDIAVDPHGKPWIADSYNHIYRFNA